jgi:hypothetical protein
LIPPDRIDAKPSHYQTIREIDMKLIPRASDDRAIEHRRNDRRRFSMRTLYGTLFLRRRRTSRREDDLLNSYIDWYGPWPLIATIMITVMCCLDAFFTLILIGNGAVEMNIFMDWLIQKDVQMFAIVKMSVTSVALVVLVMHFNFRIYRVIAVRYVMYALVPIYMALIAHEINLLQQVI